MKIEKIVPEPVAETYTISGLTHKEMEMIRNAMFYRASPADYQEPTIAQQNTARNIHSAIWLAQYGTEYPRVNYES